jgi:hypothetical protein
MIIFLYIVHYYSIKIREGHSHRAIFVQAYQIYLGIIRPDSF